MKIALLGAESTGKTWLATALAQTLGARGHRVAVVPEVLREWCHARGRTPRADEQMAIAQTQEARVDAAAAEHAVVIADTTAVMVATYSAMLFDDTSLYPFALERQRGYDLTLLTGLDLPWVADGLQRDGPHVRAPVDALVRAALDRAGLTYRVVYGSGTRRLENALSAIDALAAETCQPRADTATSAPTDDASLRQGTWVWQCDKCSDPVCEHRLFSRLTSARP